MNKIESFTHMNYLLYLIFWNLIYHNTFNKIHYNRSNKFFTVKMKNEKADIYPLDLLKSNNKTITITKISANAMRSHRKSYMRGCILIYKANGFTNCKCDI